MWAEQVNWQACIAARVADSVGSWLVHLGNEPPFISASCQGSCSQCWKAIWRRRFEMYILGMAAKGWRFVLHAQRLCGRGLEIWLTMQWASFASCASR